MQDVASETLYPTADSWYMGANIPGKPRVFLPYIGGLDVYRAKCDEIAVAGYPGYLFGGTDLPAPWLPAARLPSPWTAPLEAGHAAR